MADRLPITRQAIGKQLALLSEAGLTAEPGERRRVRYRLRSAPMHITYATICQGPYNESIRYRDFLDLDMPSYSAHESAGALLAGRRVGIFHLVCDLRRGDWAFETYWTDGRGVEAMANSYSLLDLTVYGGRRPGRNRRRGGRRASNSEACISASTIVRLPSGLFWQLDALTTLAPGASAGRWRRAKRGMSRGRLV